MKMTTKDVERAAQLVRLHISDEQKEVIAKQLDAFLSFADKLNDLDTENVEPTTHGLSQMNVMREDETRPSLPLEKVFQNAPEEEDGHFKVPAILD